MALEESLKHIVQGFGPELNGPVPQPIYDLLRRYGPMACVDVVIVPEESRPSIVLAKRNNKAVAPNQWWIFGGRVDKSLKYENTAAQKVRREIGLDVEVSDNDLIGVGRTYFAPDVEEAVLRDHDVSTLNLCFAKRVSSAVLESRLKPADGHKDEWKQFFEIDSLWHPYLVHAVANAWDLLYPTESKWRSDLTSEVKRILSTDKYSFTPLRHHSLNL